MGGFGSGRSGGRATTGDGLTLSLSKLFRERLFRPGCEWGGSLVWTNTTTGERVGSIGYEAHLCHEFGRVRLKYTTTRWNGERRESDYWIQLETRPNHSAADGGGSSAHGREGGPPNSTSRTVPSPLHREKATGSPIARSGKPPATAPCGVLSSCGASSDRMAALATISPNRNGCAGRPTTVGSKKSLPPKRS
jgi:hypothetical protein